jgi:hypothetical protein
MGNSLTEGTIAAAMVERNFAGRRRKRSGDLDDIALQNPMDMRLGEKALQRKGERGYEHDKAGRGTHAPDIRMPR